MVNKSEPKMVPTDIEGKPLPTLTPEQHEKREEVEYERLMKTANKGTYNLWSREEKHILIKWAQHNYDTSLADFKNIVESFIARVPFGENKVLRSFQKMVGDGREIDVLCMHCARVHSFDVPVAARGWWTLPAPCVLSLRPPIGTIRILDQTPIATWEHKLLDDELEKKK